MTDAEILQQVRDALRQGEQQSTHLRGAWIATAEEKLKHIPPTRRRSERDLQSIARCLDEASRAHQAKDWTRMMSFIQSTHYALDRVIGPG
jgi:hypothetical protein